MPDSVNLRQVRKRRARDDAARKAAENRARFGEAKRDATLRTAREAQEAKRIESHRRERNRDGDAQM